MPPLLMLLLLLRWPTPLRTNSFALCCQVECYTLGAPRVGNSTFVRDYDRHVAETWHIINDTDTVRHQRCD